MRKLATALLLLTGCNFGQLPPAETPPTVCTSESHVWENYHLPHDMLSLVVVNMSGYTPNIDVWNDLGTPISLRDAGTGFTILVTEGGDATSSWLGLASVRVDSRGHILSAKVTMNRTLLSKYSPRVAAHVLAQEIGHLLGLSHQRGADDSCMEDCVGRGSGWRQCMNSEAGVTPNAHDGEQLRAIYAHAAEPVVPPCVGVARSALIHEFEVP